MFIKAIFTEPCVGISLSVRMGFFTGEYSSERRLSKLTPPPSDKVSKSRPDGRNIAVSQGSRGHTQVQPLTRSTVDIAGA